jgi:hypothetical protein
VGHTHEDIDQRFRIISKTLKRINIDSLKELMELVEQGSSYTEAFVSARHLEMYRIGSHSLRPICSLEVIHSPESQFHIK